MHKVELLAPVSNLEELKIALKYGADAVYTGGEIFGCETTSRNFTKEEIKEGSEFAHKLGKKLYVTVNVIPHNDDFIQLDEYLRELQEAKVDAIIIADPGVLSIVRNVVPNMEVHLSSQANIANYVTADFWYTQGVKRVTVARELSFKEISQIRAKTSFDMDIEAFMHGAICISYSGRRLISNYLNGRGDANNSNDYSGKLEYNLIEEKRQGEYYPVYEDKRGTFFYNSKDLCMIEYIPDLIKTGINSLKIEGKTKNIYNLASIVRAYKMAIDEFYKNPDEWKFNPTWLEEIKKGTSRDFTTGFYLDETREYDNEDEQYYNINKYEFVGLVKDIENELALIKLEDKINIGDEVEVISPFKETISSKIEQIYNANDEEIELAEKEQIVKIKLSQSIDKDCMLRRESKDEK
ncbi:peptidase U32 family protein [Faecalimicrobium sp. JNUCC 81]